MKPLVSSSTMAVRTQSSTTTTG